MAQKRPRKNSYSQALADSLIEWVSAGKLLIDWCKETGVSRSAVYAWTERYQDFRGRFAHARDFGDDILEEEAMQISDTSAYEKEYEVEGESERGPYRSTKKSDNVARSRLRAEIRLKIVARRKGGKVRHEITAAPDALPIKYENSLPDLTPEQVIEIARMNDEEAK